MARPLGSRTKNKQFLTKRLQEMYGEDFNAVIKMSECAIELHKIATVSKEGDDWKKAIDGWDKVAQYIEPKLTARS